MTAVPDTYEVARLRFPRVRQSRLAGFDRCALSAHFDETYRSTWSSAPQARGTIFHRVAAAAMRTMYENNERTIPTDVAVALLEHELRQADVDKACVACGKPVVRIWQRDDGAIRVECEDGHEHGSDFVNLPASEVKDLRWVVVKWAKENEFDTANLVDVEQRLQAMIDVREPNGNLVKRVLTGALDAVFVTGEEDEHAIVLDYKDTWGLPGPTELDFDGYFQQRFYAWLLFRNFPGIKVVTLRECYVRFTEVREAVVYRGDIDDVEAELSALVERYDRAFTLNVFPPSPGRHCLFCPRPGACPIFPGVRGEGMIQDQETAERYAGEAQVAKSALKQRTDAMNAWSTVHGPGIEISDHKGKRVWGHKEVTRTARPTKDEMEEALRAQRNGQPIDIDSLYKTTKGTRFEPHMPTPKEDLPNDAALMSALEASVADHDQRVE